MRKTVKKLFWAWDFDREEAWLNEMAAKGLSLVSVGFCRYDFEETEPGAYRIALELLPQMPSHPESEQYLRFLEEAGIETVGSYFRWVYVRKKTDGGEFALFSDRKSKIAHLVRIIILVGIVAGLNLYCGFYNLFIWTQFHMSISVITSCFSFALGLFSTCGAIRLGIKAIRLAKEAKVYEE